jgi:excisionase family DNA binding protein|tara:strand:- start:435 stop:626 length:192 start_codon:yes stop_codon:yes gene_type:complete
MMNPSIREERLLTTAEISELFNLKKSTIYQWVHKGYVLPIKFGKKMNRYYASQFEALLNDQRN